MEKRPIYVYIVCAGGNRHAASTAKSIRFSVESMMHPVFYAKDQDAQTRAVALKEADVLLLTDADPAAGEDALVREALDAFREKENGRVFVYAKSNAFAKQIPGATFVRESGGSTSDILKELLSLEEEQQDEYEQAREREEDPTPPGRFDNMKNILFICAFLAVICILFRLLVSFLK